ncbi:MAG TPA: peptide chain release factor 1 [Candidatus Gemmiger stercoravium]|nr:peptide chain release factor 1 [Candidatus Gemmiger stercoravium]
MFEELYEVQRRYEELAYRMTTPGAAADAAGYARLMRDYKELTPLIETWQRYRGLQAEIAEEEQALEQEQDPAFTDMVQQELRKNRETLSVLEENLRVLLLPRDADDDKSIIMEIRAGTGGEEAALFARDLYRMYTMYAARRGWGCETVSASETELGGLKEIVFSIEGAGVYSRLKFESGAHRVQRVPQTEAQGRIQTSAATVAVMPEAEEVELELDPRDLRIDTFRASGAGGQHINKTSSAIRVTHLPTGLVVECQDQRSQRENRDRALKVLRSRLLQQKQQAYDQEYNARRQSQVGSGDRSERIRTYNFPQGRLTDHRIGLTIYRLDEVLDGDLDLVVEPLLLADREEKLKQQSGAGQG